LGNGKASEVKFQDDNEANDCEAAEQPDARSESAGLTPEEELRIWKREGFDDLPPTLSVPAAGKYIGVSRSKAYNMRKEGTMRAIVCGSSLRVPRCELFRLLHGRRASRTAA